MSQSVQTDPTGLMLMRPGRPPRGQSQALGSTEEDSFCLCRFIKQKRRTVSPGDPKNPDSMSEKARERQTENNNPETEREDREDRNDRDASDQK